jgi:hypothetical protein
VNKRLACDSLTAPRRVHVQALQRLFVLILKALVDRPPVVPKNVDGSAERHGMDEDGEHDEDAWGVIGKKVGCQSCGGGGSLDDEPCPGCLGYGWISSRPDG